MKYILIIFFPFLLSSQIPSEVKHFYGSCFLNEVAYDVQTYFTPQKKSWKRAIIANLITGIIGVSKEANDKYRCIKTKRTGFNPWDVADNTWATACWDVSRIVRDDQNMIDTMMYQNLGIDTLKNQNISTNY